MLRTRRDAPMQQSGQPIDDKNVLFEFNEGFLTLCVVLSNSLDPGSESNFKRDPNTLEKFYRGLEKKKHVSNISIYHFKIFIFTYTHI